MSTIRNSNPPPSVLPRNAYGVRGLPAEVVSLWWTEFQRLGSLAAVGRRYGRTATAISNALAERGYRPKAPPPGNFVPRGRHNQFMKTKRPLSRARLIRLMGACDKVFVPPAIRTEWREWPEKKRRWWSRTLQRRIDRLHPERALPAGPCAAGFEKFDYWSPRAQAIAAAANADRPSNQWTFHLRLASRGLIWRGRLWFYSWDDHYYYLGPFRRGIGRPSLHQTVWSETHGPIPRGHVLRFRDGNRNNITPANLELVPRRAVLIESRQRYFRERARAQTALLLDHSQRKKTHAHHQLVRSLAAGG